MNYLHFELFIVSINLSKGCLVMHVLGLLV